MRTPPLKTVLGTKGNTAALMDGTVRPNGFVLDFERALARAEASCGVIPASAADGIERASRDVRFDLRALVREARRAGTLAIPFVKQLTSAIASHDADAARYVHWGATSQDVLDTALVLQSRRATQALLAQVGRLGDAVARIADAHRRTPTVARTLLQPATPVPFGWKAAVWLDALTRSRVGLARAAAEAEVLQFGGASGVRAAFGAAGDTVAQALARELDLVLPSTPWHAVRDRVARLGSEVGIACCVVAKIAGDVALLMQPEVAEAFEPTGPGRGGSSAMPHKRNPVGAMLAREAGLRYRGSWLRFFPALPASTSAASASGKANGGRFATFSLRRVAAPKRWSK